MLDITIHHCMGEQAIVDESLQLFCAKKMCLEL